MWVCSYGVVNCRICMRPMDNSTEARAKRTSRTIEKVSTALANGSVKAKVSFKGDIAFTGLTDAERDGLTDAEIYRNLLVSGSSLARAKLAQAELLAGRKVDPKIVVHVGAASGFRAEGLANAV